MKDDAPGVMNAVPCPGIRFQASVGRTIAECDPPEFSQPAMPPKGAPNKATVELDPQ